VLFVNKWWFSTSWDTRDLFYNPSNGFYLKETLTFAGGPFLGKTHYVRSDSKADFYFTLFNFEIFEDWKIKGVLRFQSALSLMYPTFNYEGGSVFSADTQEMLYIDGMFSARGWPVSVNGVALWNNKLELRMPLIEQLLWWDFFIDGAKLYRSMNQLPNLLQGTDFKFSMGAGIRFTNPQLPLGLYIAKRFTIDNNWNIQWINDSDLFQDTLGLRLVLTLGIDLY
jgi:outer membrane protein insertion porin family